MFLDLFCIALNFRFQKVVRHAVIRLTHVRPTMIHLTHLRHTVIRLTRVRSTVIRGTDVQHINRWLCASLREALMLC